MEHRLALEGGAHYGCFNITCLNRSAGEAPQYQVSLPEGGLLSKCAEGSSWVKLHDSSSDMAGILCLDFQEVCSHLDVEYDPWSGRDLFLIAMGAFLLLFVVGAATTWALRWRRKRAAPEETNPVTDVPREAVASGNGKKCLPRQRWIARSFCSSFCSSEPGSSFYCKSGSIVSGSVPTIIVWPPSPAPNCTASCQVIVPTPIEEAKSVEISKDDFQALFPEDIVPNPIEDAKSVDFSKDVTESESH